MLTLSAGSQLSVSGTLDANDGMDLGGDVVIQGTTLNNHGTAIWNGGYRRRFALWRSSHQ